MSQQFIHIPPNAKIVARHGTKSLLGTKDGDMVLVDEASGTIRKADDHDLLAMDAFVGDHNSDWATERIKAFRQSNKSLSTAPSLSEKAVQKGKKGRKPENKDSSQAQFLSLLPKQFTDWAKNWQPGDALPLLPPGFDPIKACDGHATPQRVLDNMPTTADDVADELLKALRMPMRAPVDANKELRNAYEKGLLGRAIREVSPNMLALVARARGLWIDSLNKIRCGPGSAAANRFTDIFGTNCNLPPSPSEITEGVSGVTARIGEAAGDASRAAREGVGDAARGAKKAQMVIPLSSAVAEIADNDETVYVEKGKGYEPIGQMARGNIIPGGAIPLKGKRERVEETRRLNRQYKERRQRSREYLREKRAQGMSYEDILEQRMRDLGFSSATGTFGPAYFHDLAEQDASLAAARGGVPRMQTQPLSTTVLDHIVERVAERALPLESEEYRREWLERSPFDRDKKIGAWLDSRIASQDTNREKIVLDLLDQIEALARTNDGYELLTKNVPVSFHVISGQQKTATEREAPLVQVTIGGPAPLVQVTIGGPQNPAGTIGNFADLAAGTEEPRLGFSLSGEAQRSGAYVIVGEPIHKILEKGWNDVVAGNVPSYPVHITVGLRDDYLGPRRTRSAKNFMDATGVHHLGIEPGNTEAFIEATTVHEPEHPQDFLRKVQNLLGYADGAEWADRLRRQFTYDAKTGQVTGVEQLSMTPNGEVSGPLDLWLDARGGTNLREALDATFAPIFGVQGMGVPSNVVRLSPEQKQLRLFMFYMQNIAYTDDVRSRFIQFAANSGYSKGTIKALIDQVEESLAERGFERGTINIFNDVLDNVIGEWDEAAQDFVPKPQLMPILGGGPLPQPDLKGKNPISLKEKQALQDFVGSSYAAASDIELMAELGRSLSRPREIVLADIDDYVADPMRNSQKMTKKELMTALGNRVGMDRVEHLLGRSAKPRTSQSPQSVGSRAGSSFIPQPTPGPQSVSRPAIGTGTPGDGEPDQGGAPTQTPPSGTARRPSTSTFVTPKPRRRGTTTFDETREVVVPTTQPAQGRPSVPMEQQAPERPQIQMRPRQPELPSGRQDQPQTRRASTDRPRIEMTRRPDGSIVEDPFTGQPEVTVVYPGRQRVRRPGGRSESEMGRFFPRGTSPRGVARTQQISNNVFRHSDSEEREIIDLDPNRPDQSRPVRISETEFVDPVYGLIFSEPEGSEFIAEPFDPSTAPRRRRLDPDTGELIDVNPRPATEERTNLPEPAPSLDRQNMATAMREARMKATDQSLVDWFSFNVENWAELMTENAEERQRISQRLRRDLAMLGYDLTDFAEQARSDSSFISNYVLSALANQVRSWKTGGGGRTDEEVARIMNVPLWVVQAAMDSQD